jgi:hypothetical protein
MDSLQIAFASLLAILIGAWSCRYLYLRRLRERHGFHRASLARPDTVTLVKGPVRPLNRQHWVSVAQKLNDRTLVYLARGWQILELIFVVGVVAVPVFHWVL